MSFDKTGLFCIYEKKQPENKRYEFRGILTSMLAKEETIGFADNWMKRVI